MVLNLVTKVVRRLHFQSIAQTGYDESESGEACVYIIFNKSRDFYELINNCFCVLFVRRDCLCKRRMIFYY